MIMLIIVELNYLAILKQDDLIFPLLENEYILSFYFIFNFWVTVEMWPEIIESTH